VTSFPPAVITWSKLLGELTRTRAISKDGQLSIMNAQKTDSGLYKCKASNILGHESTVTQLVVVELPQFTVSPPAKLEVYQNQNITVPCQATGDPPPTVTWTKQNVALPFGRSNVSVDGTLQMWNLKREDSGIYTCMASSAEVFKAFAAMKLTVGGNKYLDLTILIISILNLTLNKCYNGNYPIENIKHRLGMRVKYVEYFLVIYAELHFKKLNQLSTTGQS